MHEHLGSLVDVITTLIDELERAGLPYALGGAIAYSAWAEPRATRDVDLNIWLDIDRFDPGFDALEKCGVVLDRAAATKEGKERGMFVARCGEYRVDVFLPSVPFYDEALARRQRLRFADRATWVLSPETLAVFKMLFHRPKDLADLGRLLEIQGNDFDSAFVRHWLVEVLGVGDGRIHNWDDLVRRHGRL